MAGYPRLRLKRSIEEYMNKRGSLIPWLWLLPSLIFIVVFLVYPVVDTLRLSLMNDDSSVYVGLSNYQRILVDSTTQAALLNNVLWLVFFTVLTVGIGLVLAVLTGHVRYESLAKAAVFIPMAISFVAAAVIWRFVYAYKPEGFTQIGLVNAVGTGLGLKPVAWMVEQQLPYVGLLLPAPFHTNNIAIIVVGVWMWTGFAMVVLSAGLKGISTEVLEAARVDGANEWQIFWRIIIPQLSPTIAVVATTLVIQALKKFDMVWVMTAGNFGTDVVATFMYKLMFNFRDFGRAAALAV
ncbi:MAG: sugar ABC transporter permease, partial [Dehalococcoidales bacterium]|nr:sugar ABC transporter permease [Dehalococcoidales bacterium]